MMMMKLMNKVRKDLQNLKIRRRSFRRVPERIDLFLDPLGMLCVVLLLLLMLMWKGTNSSHSAENDR